MAGKRVLLLGATGTIGRATARALVDHGYEVVALVRPRPGESCAGLRGASDAAFAGVELRHGQASNPESLEKDGFRGESFDALVSCLASRTGSARDAWAIDHRTHMEALTLAQRHGVSHFALLSAICVQKPQLEFQRAKLAFEEALIGSGLRYSIIRPTAFFKSLSGQFERVRQGKPYLMFGDGTLTRCKPISDRDLGAFIAGCLANSEFYNRVLPIGGPGPAITPREQGEHMFRLLGRRPKFRSVPVALLDVIIAALSLTGKILPAAAEKAELARIGRYYARESMLVLDPVTGLYDEQLTPSIGGDTLLDFYAALARGEVLADLGDHAVF